jgi:hypothetical protein
VMNFRSKPDKLNRIQVADTVTLEHNYSLIMALMAMVP